MSTRNSEPAPSSSTFCFQKKTRKTPKPAREKRTRPSRGNSLLLSPLLARGCPGFPTFRPSLASAALWIGCPASEETDRPKKCRIREFKYHKSAIIKHQFSGKSREMLLGHSGLRGEPNLRGLASEMSLKKAFCPQYLKFCFLRSQKSWKRPGFCQFSLVCAVKSSWNSSCFAWLNIPLLPSQLLIPSKGWILGREQ